MDEQSKLLAEFRDTNALMAKQIKRQTRITCVLTVFVALILCVMLVFLLVLLPQLTSAMDNIKEMTGTVASTMDALDAQKFNDAVEALSKVIDPLASILEKFS